MKKFTFILAALFAATFANAQITLDGTFEGVHLRILTDGGSISDDEIPSNVLQAPYFFIEGASGWHETYSCWLELYDIETLNLYKRITFNDDDADIFYISKNIFTTDGKVAFIRGDKIVNEDGQVVFTLTVDPSSSLRYNLIKTNGAYKLLVYEQSWSSNPNGDGPGEEFLKTSVYSLPGNGEAQAISTPSSPKRSARKIARDGQVLIETETNTYTLQGAEVK